MDMLTGTIFQTAVNLISASGSAILAVIYFRYVRLDRPPVGVFNSRDILMILCFLTSLPFLYLIVPSYVLTGFLILTFSSALYIVLRPFLRPRYLWLLVIFLLAVNIMVTETLLGTRSGWQLYWVLTDIIVLGAIVGVSNLYVQGGMRLRHVAWFALFLAFYDAFFSLVVPISLQLADRFEGQPLDPSIGFTIGPYSANLGIGDLLVFTLFIVAAYKGFGRRGVISSLVIIAIFGALIPSLSPLVVAAFVRTNIGIVIPVQTFFGPVAFVTYFLLSRRSKERSMAQWLSIQAAEGHEPIRVTRQRPATTALAANAQTATEVRTN
ncbi:MAG TPA: hypothetical protein VFU49_20415 [Ktedonobacteraceae bacterium]|nr:hypothetical protein [Ktedonobacteraceae bacterium]